MKRVRTISVFALGWLGSATSADDLGWKAAAVPPVVAAPKGIDKPLPSPLDVVPATDVPWKTAAPTIPIVILPSQPEVSSPDPLLRPAALPQPSQSGGLEPLAPPALLPPVEREAVPILPAGPRVAGEPRFPTELPALPMSELPKPPVAESLPPPRPVLGPKPVCNDAPTGSIPSASLQRASAVTPAEAGIPVRRHVFGSPPVRLSHDYLFRDLFGLDLLTRGPNAARAIPEDSFFVQAEYLLWWANRANIPVLATTNRLAPTAILGQPGTQSLLGPGTFGPELRDGFRIRGGAWLDDCGLRGIDAGYFFLGRRSESASFDSTQFPVINRPFFAPNIGREFAELVAQPNRLTGRIDITADTFLWGADVNFRKALCRTCDRTTGWFAGYRHLNLSERLTISETLDVIGPGEQDPIGTRVFVRDRFETRNRFHGGQIGGFWNRRLGQFDWDLRAGIALGSTLQTVEIEGLQQRTRPGEATENFRGGLLATGPNLGTFTQSKFSVVPEITTNLGYRVLPNLRLSVGYNFLYWSNVVRPGDQIDRVVDLALVPNFVPNPPGIAPTANPRPLPTFRQSDFWAHGVQFGVEYRW